MQYIFSVRNPLLTDDSPSTASPGREGRPKPGRISPDRPVELPVPPPKAALVPPRAAFFCRVAAWWSDPPLSPLPKGEGEPEACPDGVVPRMVWLPLP